MDRPATCVAEPPFDASFPASAERRRKIAVLQFHREILGDGRIDLLDARVAEGYLTHLPRHRGLPRLTQGRTALASRLRSCGKVPNDIRRVIADGDTVYVHVAYTGERPFAGVDIYRLDEHDRIAEHWSVRQEMYADRARGIDRLGDDRGVSHTPGLNREWTRGRVRDALEQLWMRGDESLVPRFYADTYVQHNPDMPGGYSRIQEVVRNNIRTYIARTGGPFPIEILRLGAEGDLVFAHISIFMAGINRNEGDRSTNVDVFRVGGDGRFTEHWDVLQMEREPVERVDLLF